MIEQGANLLFEKELASELLASPFIWKQKASPTARSDWVWGIVTTEYDPEEAGSTTVIPMFRGNRRAEDFPVLKGFELYEKDPVAVGDWNGEGDNELVIVDWEGQVRAYGFGNRPLAGVEPCPSPAAILLYPPLVVDVDNWQLSCGGGLANVAPTVLQLMGIRPPAAMPAPPLLLKQLPRPRRDNRIQPRRLRGVA